MEVKLGTHIYFSVSMTTIHKKTASGTFSYNYFFTSHKLANHAMQGRV